MAVLAVIFDFDDTLLPDSTSALLEAHGVDADDFWNVRTKKLVEEQGYDPPLAYLNLLLDEVGEGKRLGKLTHAGLKELGATLDDTWFLGLPRLFNDLRKIAGEQRDIAIEFYIISGGLQAVIEGSKRVTKFFNGVYGCQLGEDPETGVVASVKRCVTFTEKTRFLFEINKGISQTDAATKPHLVNEQVNAADRRVPFENMIYVGDGLTDIPCFSLIKSGGGTPFGVFQAGEESAKQAFQSFLATERVSGLYHPNYRKSAPLGSMLRAAVATKCGNILLKSASAIPQD